MIRSDDEGRLLVGWEGEMMMCLHSGHVDTNTVANDHDGG